MLVYNPRDFRKNEKEDNRHGPEVYYELSRIHPICVLDNETINGQPYVERNWTRGHAKVKSRIYGTTFEICMLPVVKIKGKPNTSVEACFELAFDSQKPSVLKGDKLMSAQRL